MEAMIMEQTIVDKILQIVNANLDDNKIEENMFSVKLGEIGMDSLAFIRIVVMLEEEFNIEIPDSKLIISEMDTVGKMYNVVYEIIKEE